MQDNELKIEDLIGMSVEFIKKNLIFILVLIVLGVLLGIYRYTRSEIAYETKTIARSEFVPLDLIKTEVLHLNDLLEEGNYTALSEKLGIESELLNHVSSLEYVLISSTDKLFALKIKSLGDSTLNDQVRMGLSTYLKDNSYLQFYLEEERTKLQEAIKFYTNELESLNSLKSKMLFGSGNKPDYELISDPSTLSSLVIDYQKVILANKQLLERLEVFIEIDSAQIKNPPSIKMSIFSTVLVMSFLGMIALILYRLFFSK